MYFQCINEVNKFLGRLIKLEKELKFIFLIYSKLFYLLCSYLKIRDFLLKGYDQKNFIQIKIFLFFKLILQKDFKFFS